MKKAIIAAVLAAVMAQPVMAADKSWAMYGRGYQPCSDLISDTNAGVNRDSWTQWINGAATMLSSITSIMTDKHPLKTVNDIRTLVINLFLYCEEHPRQPLAEAMLTIHAASMDAVEPGLSARFLDALTGAKKK